MIGFVLRRLASAVIVMLAVALVAFSLFRFVGDPVNMIASDQDSLAVREAIRERLGLNDSILKQFSNFVGRTVQGDFGRSYRTQEPVGRLLAERIPATLELVLLSALFALMLGIPAGILSAIYRNGIASHLIQIASLIGVSLPAFLLGTLLIYVFSVQLRILPSFGRGETVAIGWWTTGLLTKSGLRSLILPSITLGLFQLTLVMRLVRAEMIETLSSDYIRFAMARGLSKLSVYFNHAFRNVLIPIVTVTGVQLGSLIAFAVITETVFQWPGLGSLFIQAVATVDIPVMAAYLIMVGAMFVLLNLIVDALYIVIDPRLRGQTTSGAA